MPPADHLLIERDRGQFVPSRRRRMMANVRAERLLKIPAEPSPELGIPGAAAQTRVVSMAKIRLDRRKSTRLFKGIICDDISEFESHMPSQTVQSHSGRGERDAEPSLHPFCLVGTEYHRAYNRESAFPPTSPSPPGNAKAPVEIDPLLPGPSSILFLHRMGLLRGSSCCFQEQGALLRVRQITQIAREPSPSGLGPKCAKK